MKNLITGCFLFLLTCQCTAQSANTWSVKFSDAIISRWPSNINSMTSKGWEYSNTIITHGMEKVYNSVPTGAYLTYIKTYIDSYVDASGNITATMSSLDRVHPGISVLFLYEQLKSNPANATKYHNAATNIRNVLIGGSYTKTNNGLYWHKLSGYNNIVMLDGIYMAHPFLAKYGSLFGDNVAIDTAVNQTLAVYGKLYDNTTHLIKHAWTSTPASYSTWANASTGNSSEVWSRAMGWYMMALVDILKYVPVSHPKRANLLTALSNLAIGIKDYQDASTGLWYQVVDKGVGHTGYTSANYIETSGSAMFVYALKTAVDNGWLSAVTYLPVAQDGWDGLKALEITTYSDGKPQINNFAPAMSYQSNYTGYVGITPVDCPSTVNPHGYAAILMAASVMEFTSALLPVKFTAFSAREFHNNTELNWQNTESAGVDYYNIQKSADGIYFNTIGKMAPNQTGSYAWTDMNFSALAGAYYRIQAILHDGSITNTQILFIRTKAGNSKLTIYPNPASGKTFSISVTNLAAGVYNLKIINNNAGIPVAAQSISTGVGTNLYQSIALPPGAKPGLYFVQFEGAGNQLYKSILIN